MGTAITTALLTFLFTGLIANRLVQQWQHRNWKSQQRLSDTERKYQEFQELFDEVAALASRRQHKMVRLLSSIRSGDVDLVKQRLAEYDTALVDWNEKLNAIFAKLTMYLRWQFTKRLEGHIQPTFVRIGRELEALARARILRSEGNLPKCRQLQRELDRLQRDIFEFNRDVLRFILTKRDELYEEIPFSADTLDRFPTWELFKALFKPRVQR
jgi:hypothetical protein